jgi:antitoxin FitA
MGHSFGGAFVQLLLDAGYGAAGVSIDGAVVKGIKALPFSEIKSTFPVLKNPACSAKTSRRTSNVPKRSRRTSCFPDAVTTPAAKAAGKRSTGHSLPHPATSAITIISSLLFSCSVPSSRSSPHDCVISAYRCTVLRVSARQQGPPPAAADRITLRPASAASIDCNDSTRWERLMATLTIRDFDDDLKAALRVRAAEHGRSMESEVREILRAALERPVNGLGMGTRIRQRFAGIGGVDLDLPSRAESPRAADLDE